MQISSLLSDVEIKELQQKFYEYFETGYAFEEFLKEYLLKMGLDEVEVTQRSRDGGVDLTAVRKGVGDFSEIDVTKYHIQAKRYEPTNKIPPKDVQALRGTLLPGYKGMFITTSVFSERAIQDADSNTYIPIVLIDGKALVTSCIDKQIGFIFKPIFSTKQMDLFVKKSKPEKTIENAQSSSKEDNYIEKIITANDIRARIVSIPSSIMRQFMPEQKAVDIVVNDAKKYSFNINKGRNYFGGVTAFLRDYNMISEDGVITPTQSKWYYNVAEKVVYLEIGE